MGHESYTYGTWLIDCDGCYSSWQIWRGYLCIWDMTHLCKWGMNPIHMGHCWILAAAATVRDKFGADTCVYGTWLICVNGVCILYIWDTTHCLRRLPQFVTNLARVLVYMGHDFFMYIVYESYTYGTWLIDCDGCRSSWQIWRGYLFIWDMTHLCILDMNPIHMGHGWILAATATVRDKFGMGTYCRAFFFDILYVWHDSVYMRDMTPFLRVTWLLNRIYVYVSICIYICIYIFACTYIYICI